jgi:hypothetical protein
LPTVHEERPPNRESGKSSEITVGYAVGYAVGYKDEPIVVYISNALRRKF